MAPVLSDTELAKLKEQLKTKVVIQPWNDSYLDEAFLAVQQKLVSRKTELWNAMPQYLGPGEKKLILAYGAKMFGHKEGARTAKEWITMKRYKTHRWHLVLHHVFPASAVGLAAGLLTDWQFGLIIGGLSVAFYATYASLRAIFTRT